MIVRLRIGIVVLEEGGYSLRRLCQAVHMALGRSLELGLVSTGTVVLIACSRLVLSRSSGFNSGE